MPPCDGDAPLRLGAGAAAAARAAPPVAAPTYVDGSFVSAARGGVATNWAIARPPGQTGPAAARSSRCTARVRTPRA